METDSTISVQYASGIDYKSEDYLRGYADGKAAVAERKTGKWIDKPDPYGFFDTIPVCSECDHVPKYRVKTPFCPHCGAKMEGNE